MFRKMYKKGKYSYSWVSAKINSPMKIHEMVLAMLSDDNNKINRRGWSLGLHFHSTLNGGSPVP
jgi:hypothetical protein